MRRIIIAAVSLLCAASALAAGCGNKTAQSPGGQPLPPRDTSTLDSALLGHWRDKAGNELYFSPDTVTFVPAATGEEYASGYTIISRDDVLKSMKLEFSEPGEIFAAAYPDSDQYPSVFFRKPGLDGLIFGAIFFSLKARNGMSLSETEYPFIDTRQQP